MNSPDKVRLDVHPASAPVDVPRSIRATGFRPYSFVHIEASAHFDGSRWTSRARFLANACGEVDTAELTPLSGSYTNRSAMGPIWSMQCEDISRVLFPPVSLEPIVIDLSAHDERGQSARATLTQVLLAEGVTRRAIAEEGVFGTLFTPPGQGPHPATVFLNGSSGGINEARAALWAARGYTCLALGYFRVPGRADFIDDTPLEYFENALVWLRKTVKPRGGFVAVSGLSRGGELSLLLGATYPELVSAVIAFVPSAMLHGTVSAGRDPNARNATAWTLGGKPLTHLWEGNACGDWTISHGQTPPIRQTPAFISALGDAQCIMRSMIPVERIRAPVLLISASDDGFWPSTVYCEMVAQRLQRAGHPFLVRHLDCEGAGHFTHFPYLPSTVIDKPHAVSKVVLSAGGTPAANATANERSHQAVLDFLAQVAPGR